MLLIAGVPLHRPRYPYVSGILYPKFTLLTAYEVGELQFIDIAQKMCSYLLTIHPCGDSYITRTTICPSCRPFPTPSLNATSSSGVTTTTQITVTGPASYGPCAEFQVTNTCWSVQDCFYCRRSPKRRGLPARARGIFAPS